jgi:hypothetical protein
MGAAMARRKQRSPATPRAVAAAEREYALTTFQWKSGRYEAAAHADPDRPMFEKSKDGALVQVGFHQIQGTRVVQHYRRICQTPRQVLVCQSLGELVEEAGGARHRPEAMVTRLKPWEKGHPCDQLLDAQTALRRVKAAVGESAWDLLDLVAVQNKRINDLAATGDARAVLRGRFLAAVDRLAEHWRI